MKDDGEGDDEDNTKRRRIDEMSSEMKAIKYLPPLIGKADRHIIHDYTRTTKAGEAWDFNARPMRAKAMNKMVEVAPSLIVIGQLRGQVLPDKLARHMNFSAEMATE